MKSEIQFKHEIDGWVKREIYSGIENFDELMIALPGVYPSLVIDSLSRLASKGHIKKSVFNHLIKQVTADNKNISYIEENRNVAHPLDYDWRFNNETVNQIIKIVYQLTKPNDTIVLLGVNSLYHSEIKINERKILLIDKNILNFNSKKRASFHKCDLLKDKLPPIKANLVIADPPWYEEHFRSFIWATSQFCNLNGHLLLGMPAIGTRCDMRRETNNIINWTQELGFHHLGTRKGFLTYKSPLFERNALRAVGITNIYPEWRRADLALFSKFANVNVKRPFFQTEDIWESMNFLGVDIRVREKLSTRFFDPSLISLVTNDIFPTVSRRDSRRNLVDVWTVGNRVFSCDGTNILKIILDALSLGKTPEIEIEKFLKRSITKKEYEKINFTSNQIIQIIEQERREIGIANWQLN